MNPNDQPTLVFVFVFFICFFFYLGYEVGQNTLTKDIVDDCELKLTRDKHCKIIAVPEFEE